jgi:hypothetical protein
VRKALAAQIAEASATTAKLTDEVVRLEGRARELVEAKLRAEAARLDDAERRPARARGRRPRPRADREPARVVRRRAPQLREGLGRHDAREPGRLLRALVAKVSVDEKSGMCRVELVNFDAVTSTREAA